MQLSKKLSFKKNLFLLTFIFIFLFDTPKIGYTKDVSEIQKVVLITGANRGIGLEFVRQYANLDYKVIATCRNPDKAIELKKLTIKYNNIEIEQLDVTDAIQINSLAEKFSGQPIHILINNAALLGPRNDQAFGNQDFELAQMQYAVNALGPIRVTAAFIDNVRLAGPGKIISLGSAAGSNGYLRPPADFYSYRASKAAQHFLIHNLALDLASEKIIVGLINPGLVDTRGLSKIGPDDSVPDDFAEIIKKIRSGQLKLITPKESVVAMIDIIDNLTFEQSGKFINFDGNSLPW
ncbi:MAG: SDR family oxidoreductase [Pseudomonadota bacterium]|nr:SDR family oxidoreductase [Pseudomonadota bacterium]